MLRSTFALATTLMLAGSVASAAQDGRQRTTRFADMDRNNDGVVTRAEWRGSSQSFGVHDWNRDGVLSGDEIRPGARRNNEAEDSPPFDSSQREYAFTDWTNRGFLNLDHNRDSRISRDEWHFDVATFRRADHNRDGALSRSEFLGVDGEQDDDRDDRFSYLDSNDDGRVSRAEWHGTAQRFDALDDNRDGTLTRAEMRGTAEPPSDLFTSVDVNRDGSVSRDEWHWSRASFDRRDGNRDGRLSRVEFGNDEPTTQSDAWKRGRERGLVEGRQAGREDRDRGWDLEGQRELETADSGYEPRFGNRAEYQAGYREGFRLAYREGFSR